MVSWVPLGMQNVAGGHSGECLFDFISLFLLFVLILVGGSIFILGGNRILFKLYSGGVFLEALWTFLPGVVLIFVVAPSLFLLYGGEVSQASPDVTIKVVGNQWYWTYDYSGLGGVVFDSYLKPSGEGFRLLEADNRAPFPIESGMRAVISSSDVLHSWALPAFNLKADANPGRMNVVFFSSPFSGLYFGQCSEICGANHSFMPVVLEGVPASLFLAWASSF